MDKERILSKLDKIENYLSQIEEIRPRNIEDYTKSIKDRMACERLLQISVENVLDICNMIVSELKLGLPSDEDDVFAKIENKKIITKDMKNKLIKMKGVRNILVHRYGEIEDEKIFEVLSENLEDFEKFKREIIKFIK